MNLQNSFLNPDEMLERGQRIAKNQAQMTGQVLKTQVTGQQPQMPSDSVKQASGMPDAVMQDFLKDMYAPSDTTPNPQQSQSSQNPQAVAQQLSANGGDPAKLAETRKQLAEHTKQHMETYFKPTFESKPPQEERQAEKVEREKSEEEKKRWELQQEEKKKNDVPIALKMAKNKAEMFRGAAG